MQSARQIRFLDIAGIRKNKSPIKEYIKEAIRNDKAGKKVELKTTNKYEILEKFQSALADMPELKAAFCKLHPPATRIIALFFFC